MEYGKILHCLLMWELGSIHRAAELVCFKFRRRPDGSRLYVQFIPGLEPATFMAGVLDILAQLMEVKMEEFQYHLKRNLEGHMLVDQYMRFHEKYKYLVTMRNLL